MNVIVIAGISIRLQQTVHKTWTRLDSNYVPQNSNDMSIVEAKQIYFNSVFVGKFTCSKSQELVSRYEATSNAQRLFSELVDPYTTLTASFVGATKILNFLTDFKLGKNHQKHTISEFISYWVEHFRHYDEYSFKGMKTQTGAPVVTSGTLKKILLQTAVINVTKLEMLHSLLLNLILVLDPLQHLTIPRSTGICCYII